MPVHQNLVVSDPTHARNISRGSLDMYICHSCGFVWNALFDSELLVYGEGYDNNQACSEHFENYLNTLVNTLIQDKGLKNCHIVEVGCGQGHFLKKLVNFPGANNRGTGFDPTCKNSHERDNLQFVSRYYDAKASAIKADAVLCRHVIEHVPDPMLLLHSVSDALQHSPDARVFFETPCVEWILKNRVIWDFFYEHCSLFTRDSLKYAFEKAGFLVDSVEHVFEGQYLWLEARFRKQGQSNPVTNVLSVPLDLAMEYSTLENRIFTDWAELLSLKFASGKIALWGAGAKGATFANLVDPDCKLIDCVVDINPNKQGGFIPGTGHPILGPQELGPRKIRYALLMNPNYRQENLALLKSMNLEIELIDWSEE